MKKGTKETEETKGIYLLRSLLSLMSLLLFACQPPSNPPPLQLHESRITLSTNQIPIGKPVQLQIQAQHLPDEAVELPELLNESVVEILTRESERISIDSNRTETVFDLSLTAWETGTWNVFTNSLLLNTTGNATRIHLPLIELQVRSSVSSNDVALTENLELMTLPKSWGPWILGLALIAGLAMLAAVLTVLLGRRPPPPPPPPVPPHVIALRGLQKIREENLLEPEKAEAFYIRVSSVVRTYIEGRFGLDAPDMTTEEFIREAAQSNKLNYEHRALTHSFLEQADLVKFAKAQPGYPEMQEGFSAAERLVKETMPKEDEENRS